jgi:glycosyltransferase involved in cell wall biosynthesis
MVSDIVDDIKNISGVIEAFNNATFASEVKLSIIGDGPDFKDIKQKAGSSLKNIEMLGRLSNPDALEEMAKAHCLIVNSNIETFSVVALEARGLGLQVITTKCGGIEENLDDQMQLIPRNNTATLTKAMEKAVTIKNVLPRDMSPFSLENIGREIVKHYNS